MVFGPGVYSSALSRAPSIVRSAIEWLEDQRQIRRRDETAAQRSGADYKTGIGSLAGKTVTVSLGNATAHRRLDRVRRNACEDSFYSRGGK
jgi:hypothetical protein